MTICIYCQEEKESSTSHIIPAAICNNGPLLNGAVCHECNHRINTEVENNVIQAVALVRSFFALTGKKKSLSKFPIEIEYEGEKRRDYIKTDTDLFEKTFFFKVGTDRYAMLGPMEKLDNAAEAHPKLKWSDMKEIGPDSINVSITLDLTILFGTHGLRLASKVGFEWYCLKYCSPELIQGSEHDHIRKYSLESNYSHQTARIITDNNILRQIGNLPFGAHSVILRRSPSRKIFVVFGLFNLVFYLVSIAESRIIVDDEQLFLINSQSGEIYEPSIKRYWNNLDLDNCETKEGVDAIPLLIDRVLMQLNSLKT